MRKSRFALGMNRRKAEFLLSQAAGNFREYDGVKLSLVFDDEQYFGFGESGMTAPDEFGVSIGVRDLRDIPNADGTDKRLSARFRLPVTRVSDLSFVKALVALYHEYGHYYQRYGPYYDVHSAVSELAGLENGDYYFATWHQMPHEIDAEYMGVMQAWKFMDAKFPDKSAECMLSYLNWRHRCTTYMIAPLDGDAFVLKFDGADGVGDEKARARAVDNLKAEVKSAFALAKRDSIDKPRALIPNYFMSSDLAVRLLVTDRRNWKSSPYASFFDKLIDDMSVYDESGHKRDRMMAALALHVQPGWKYTRKELLAEDLSIEHEFGLPFPETTDASRVRLGIFGPSERLAHELEHIERSAGQVPPSRDTSDLDQAVDEITCRDAGPGPDYDIS